MKKIWVLSVRTSLPEICENADTLPTSYAFEQFEDARCALRTKIKELAFSENAMFDGEGNIKKLKEYDPFISWSTKLPEHIEMLTYELLEKTQSILRTVFKENEPSLVLEEKEYADEGIVIKFSADELNIVGHKTSFADMNGYAPIIRTNIFKMDEEKDYFLYIKDQFGYGKDNMYGGYQRFSELYIDLKSTMLENSCSMACEDERNQVIKREAASILHRLGVPADIPGYLYLRTAIAMVAKNFDLSRDIQALYSNIAEQYSVTAEQVDNAIHEAIEISWDRGDVEVLFEYFSYTVQSDASFPTNSEYIAAIAERIELKNNI